MSDRRFNVLFLCTGNSARSIMGESIINSLGKGRFAGYSAGSHPNGKVNPLALELLAKNRYPTEGARSKAWDEFAAPGSPDLDFVITVCDDAAGEACPVWPGQPITAHWGISDPAAVEGTEDEKRKAFLNAFMILQRRIQLFTSLPLTSLDRFALQTRMRDIGKQ